MRRLQARPVVSPPAKHPRAPFPTRTRPNIRNQSSEVGLYVGCRLRPGSRRDGMYPMQHSEGGGVAVSPSLPDFLFWAEERRSFDHNLFLDESP
eukprot:1345030-Amorphochlora_amoeboformis.AAC.2